MTDIGSDPKPRRRRSERNREIPAGDMPPVSQEKDSGTGTHYAVGNANRGNNSFGTTASQPQWTIPPYASGSYQTMPAQDSPWVSGAQDAIGGSWTSQEQYAYTGRGNQAAPPVRNASGGQAGTKPPKRPRRRMSRAGRILAIVLPLLMILLVAAGVLVLKVLPEARAEEARKLRAQQLRAEVAPYDDRFCPNVYVDGIDLGGMTQQEARDAVNAKLHAARWTINLIWDGEVYATVTQEDVGITYDVEGALYLAWQQGHFAVKDDGSGQPVLDGDGRPVALNDEERVAAMKALEQNPYHGESATSGVDLTSIEASLNVLAQELYEPAYDATFAGFNANLTYPFIFNEETVGRVLDTDGLKERIAEMAHNGESGDIVLTTRPLYPAVTVASLKEEQFTLIGQGTTRISSTSPDDRNNNIRRAYELISGTVLRPGQQFSFNGIVGERTVANGFFPAEEYVYGEHVEGIGGGVCQASSTIYLAAVRANLRINKRTPHSLAVNYTEYGKDATVYWYDRHRIDLAFTNNTEYPIYITAAVQSDPKNKKRFVCNVCIYGHSLGEGVTYDIVTQETVIPAPEEPEIRRDKNGKYVTYKDEEYVLQEASDGTSVQSWRVKYVDGKEVSREDLYVDTYEAKPKIVYVGIKERPE